MNAWDASPLCRSGDAAVRVLSAALLLALLPAPLPAQAPTVTKLLGRATTPQAGNWFGIAVAVSDSFLLVGEPHNDDKGADAGAAHLFDARTGRYLRKLTAKDAAAGDLFGRSVALSGHLALIGAPGDSVSKGAAYLFDARSGAALATGHAVPGKLTAADGAAFNYFGESVALSGHLALIGADGDNSYKGAAYLFDARSGAALATGHAVPGKLTASDGAAFDYFGWSVALSGNLALIGASADDSGKGAAYLFDARTGKQLRKLTASDGAADDKFGHSVALSGSLALVGAYGDDSTGTNSGSAYFIRPLAAPPPVAAGRLAAKGGASGYAGATFSGFPQAYMNSAAKVVLQGALSGSGAGGGRNRGVWQQSFGGPLSLVLRLKDGNLGDDFQAAKIHNAWSVNPNNALIQLTLRGPGVNSGNNQALYNVGGSGLERITGTGGSLKSFAQVAQSGEDRVACNMRLKKGAEDVTAGSDSLIRFLTHGGLSTGTVFREGFMPTVGPAGVLGQLASRVGISWNSGFFGFSGHLIPDGGGPALQAAFSPGYNAAAVTPRAAQGNPAPDTSAQYRSFFAETIGSDGLLIWRASLKGVGVSSKNNEGLWREGGGLLLRKGQVADPVSQPNVKIARLMQFWPAGGPAQMLALVKLSGPKIRAANDLALLLWDTTAPGAVQILLQEGQSVEGTDAPKVRTIQRVDVHPSTGAYVVLASLTGASARNQALFVGAADFGNSTTQQALRLPVLRLRKGVQYRLTASDSARLTQMSLSPATDASGAGGKGQGQVISSNGDVVLTAGFSNKALEVWRLAP